MSTIAPVEPSCWEEALVKFKSEHPKLYKYLEEIRATQPQSGPDSLAESLLTVIEAKRKTLENHELPLPFNIRSSDTKARIQRALDIIWKAIQVFKTAGDVATNIDPLHAGVAWSGVNIILQMVLNGAEQNTAALEGLAQISPLVARYAKVEELYIEHKNDTRLNNAFKARLTDLYVAVLQYQVSVAHHCQRSKFVQYARALPKMDDWKVLLQEIMSKDADCRKITDLFDSEDRKIRHSELETMHLKLNIRLDAISRQMDGEHEQQRKVADMKEQQDILNWISTAAYRQDHRMIMENNKLDRDYAKAGQWLFRHPYFKKWSSRQSKDSSTIWLCGPVGTGKSSLVCLAIEHCLREMQLSNTDEEQIAYFYCSRKQGEPAGNDSKTILRSLLRQIAWSADKQSISSVIRDTYDESRRSHESGESRLSVRLCISLLSRILSDRRNSTIIIDALDECSNPLELLSNLNEIAASANSKTRFFFSSRMNVDVWEEFPRCAKVEISSQSHEDIEIYVKTEIKKRKRRLLHGKAPELEDRLIDILTRRAQGMFRWVQLQLEIFFGPRTPLRHSKDVIGKLDRLDEDVSAPQLDTVYDEIYEMNVQQAQDQLHASTALNWIMCSQSPLKIAQLVEAVSIDMEGNIDPEVDETYVMQICSNLLITDAKSYVQFAHFSVREYLMSRKTYSKYASHVQAAKTCLTYILYAEKVGREVESFTRDCFGEYALTYWPIHCSRAGKSRQQDDSLRKMFNNLMSTDKVHDAFYRWMRALTLGWVIKPSCIGPELDACLCSPPNPWFTACVWGFPEVLRTLLHDKTNLERRNKEGDTGLRLACRYGHLDIVEMLIENDVDIDATDKYGHTSLHTSIEWHQRDIVRLLLENGASCTKLTEYSAHVDYYLWIRERKLPTRLVGYNALHLVTYFESEEIMRLLLGKNVDVDARTPTGMTALHLAAEYGHTEQVRLLMDYGACINPNTKQRKIAILVAAINGHEEIVQMLLHESIFSGDDKWLLKMARVRGAIELKDELLLQQLLNDGKNEGLNGRICHILGGPSGPKALRLAIFNGNENLMALLLELGLDIELKDEEGQRALHLAAKGFREIVQLLLENGANIEAEDQHGIRALHCAAIASSNQGTVQLLLEKGANIEAEDQKGRRALHCAAMGSSNKETVHLLLENGANIEAEDRRGQRALHCAVIAMCDKGTLQLLLENGANIEAEDQWGRGALHFAAMGSSNKVIVQLLLEKGANIEAEDIMRRTALDLAVDHWNVGAVQALLDKGAIPRRFYDGFSENPRKELRKFKRWRAIQDMLSTWSESMSDYR